MRKILLTKPISDFSISVGEAAYTLSDISGHELDPREPIGLALKRFVKEKRGPHTLVDGKLYQKVMPLAQQCMSGLNWGERPKIQGVLLDAIMKTLNDKGVYLPQEIVICAAAIPAATFYAALDACNETLSDRGHELAEGIVVGIAMAERLNQLQRWPSVKIPMVRKVADPVTGEESCIAMMKSELSSTGIIKVQTFKEVRVKDFSAFVAAMTDSLRIRGNLRASETRNGRARPAGLVLSNLCLEPLV